MRILLRVRRARARRFAAALAARLARDLGARAGIELTEGPPPPPGVEALLALERLIYARPRSRAAEAVAIETPPLDGPADLVIDLSGEAPPPGGARALTLLYDGVAGEDALIGALLRGRVPRLALRREHGEIVAEAVPSLEGARGLGEAIAAVFSRVELLLIAYLTDGRTRRIDAGGRNADPLEAAGPGNAGVARYAALGIARAAAVAIYRLCTYAPHWRIGWRFNDGPDVFDRLSLEGPAWRVLPDTGHNFYADPFPVTWRGRSALFFEDLDHRAGKGVISVVEFDASGPAGPARVALEEPWHLSYPFVFAHDGDLWMVPESSARDDVALYRCVEFPLRWERHATLLSGVEAADATLFERDGLWWMMAATRPHAGGYSDTLSLYHADALAGPWRAHDGNPILVDSRCARPAGAVFARGGKWLRPVQDCGGAYGAALGLAEITRLDRDGFTQIVRAVVRPGPLWPGRKLHTWNRSGRLEVIDGAAINPKFAPLRPWAMDAQAPRRDG